MMNYVTRYQFLNELVGFHLCDALKFFNTVILESDTDLSDADKGRRLSERFAAVVAFPKAVRFFIEKLVCAERDSIRLLIDT